MGSVNSLLVLDAGCRAAAVLSVIAISFKDLLGESEFNPIKFSHTGCMGLDALLLLK